jgi:hypothetical protein
MRPRSLISPVDEGDPRAIGLAFDEVRLRHILGHEDIGLETGGGVGGERAGGVTGGYHRRYSVRGGLGMTTAGLVIGLGAALTRYVEGMLYFVRPISGVSLFPTDFLSRQTFAI